MSLKKIDVLPYDPAWPQQFQQEAERIQECLGAHCIAIHHIGSTAVPGLPSKQDLDILAVVDSLPNALSVENLGYFFSKNTPQTKVNLHVTESDHAFIDLQLTFRDYLRSHPDIRQAYGDLKQSLAKDPSSGEKISPPFTRYTLQKNAFVKDVLNRAGFDSIIMNVCMFDSEWETVRKLRRQYFFEPAGIEDPYTWTFQHPDHSHLVLYKGTQIVGYIHVQLWPESRAALWIMVIDAPYQHQGLGGAFLHLCERWLKLKGYQYLQTQASPKALAFYQRAGYTPMPFKPPNPEILDPQDTSMGKRF